MTEYELLTLIHGGENIRVEFKKSTNEITRDVYDTVCSFSNRYGGIIITHIRVTPHYDTPVECFSSIGIENRIAQESGKFIIEHEEHDVYVSADGQPISSLNLKRR